MNYLAHVWLSGDDVHRQLGGFLGDFIKGPLSSTLLDEQGEPWPETVLQGVRLHRYLDARLDQDSRYTALLDRFSPPCRRFAPIALDVFLDYLLAKHWDQLSDQPQKSFNERFYQGCRQHLSRMPPRAQTFVKHASKVDLLAGYAQPQLFLDVLGSIDRRMRRRSYVQVAGEQMLALEDELRQPVIELLRAYRQEVSEQS